MARRDLQPYEDNSNGSPYNAYFGNVAYSNTPIEYLGLPLEEIKEANSIIRDRYVTNKAVSNEMETLAKNTKVRKQDQAILDAAISDLQSGIQNVKDEDTFDKSETIINDVANKFGSNKPLNLAKEAELKREAHEADITSKIGIPKEQGGYSPIDAAKILAMSDEQNPGVRKVNTKGEIVGNNEDGVWVGGYQGYKPAAYADINKIFEFYAKDGLPDTKAFQGITQEIIDGVPYLRENGHVLSERKEAEIRAEMESLGRTDKSLSNFLNDEWETTNYGIEYEDRNAVKKAWIDSQYKDATDRVVSKFGFKSVQDTNDLKADTGKMWQYEQAAKKVELGGKVRYGDGVVDDFTPEEGKQIDKDLSDAKSEVDRLKALKDASVGVTKESYNKQLLVAEKHLSNIRDTRTNMINQSLDRPTAINELNTIVKNNNVMSSAIDELMTTHIKSDPVLIKKYANTIAKLKTEYADNPARLNKIILSYDRQFKEELSKTTYNKLYDGLLDGSLENIYDAFEGWSKKFDMNPKGTIAIRSKELIDKGYDADYVKMAEADIYNSYMSGDMTGTTNFKKINDNLNTIIQDSYEEEQFITPIDLIVSADLDVDPENKLKGSNVFDDVLTGVNNSIEAGGTFTTTAGKLITDYINKASFKSIYSDEEGGNKPDINKSKVLGVGLNTKTGKVGYAYQINNSKGKTLIFDNDTEDQRKGIKWIYDSNEIESRKNLEDIGHSQFTYTPDNTKFGKSQDELKGIQMIAQANFADMYKNNPDMWKTGTKDDIPITTLHSEVDNINSIEVTKVDEGITVKGVEYKDGTPVVFPDTDSFSSYWVRTYANTYLQ